MIEDTSFVIDVLNGEEAALDRLDLIESERRPEKLAAITVLELYEGVTRADRSAEERQAVLSVLDSKAVVPADLEVMRRAGELSGELYSAGGPIDREDCLVAATAIQEGEPVVTRNADHFDRVPHLDVVTY